jgi:hypothetical protein
VSGPVLIESMEALRRITEGIRFVEHLRRTAIPLSPQTPLPPMSLVTVHVVITSSTPSAYGFYPAVIQRLNTEYNTGWYNELPSPMEVRVQEIEGLALYSGHRYAGVVVGDLSDQFGEDEGYTAVVVDRDYVEPGCGLAINPDDGSYYVDPNDFAGNCLLVDNSNPYCPVVYVDPLCLETGGEFVIGCGLEAPGGVVKVKPSDLAGNRFFTSLIVGPGTCDLAVDLVDTSRESRTFVNDIDIARVAGGKVRFTVTKTKVTNYWNAATLHIDQEWGEPFEQVTEIDVCDLDCCDDCTITFAVSTDATEVDVDETVTLSFDSAPSGCTSPYTVEVDWGDGAVESFDSGSFPVTHAYAVAGTYEIRTTVRDKCGFAADADSIFVYAGVDAADYVTVDCCPIPIPKVLTVRITGKEVGTGAETLPDSYTVTWDGFRWAPTVTPNGGDTSGCLYVACEGDLWAYSTDSCLSAGRTQDEGGCETLESFRLVFNVTTDPSAPWADGTFTATVTVD